MAMQTASVGKFPAKKQEALATSVIKPSIKINFRTLLQYPVLQLRPDTSGSWMKLEKWEPRPQNAGDGPQALALCANRVPLRVHSRIPQPGPNRVPRPGPNRVPRPGPNRVPQPGPNQFLRLRHSQNPLRTYSRIPCI